MPYADPMPTGRPLADELHQHVHHLGAALAQGGDHVVCAQRLDDGMAAPTTLIDLNDGNTTRRKVCHSLHAVDRRRTPESRSTDLEFAGEIEHHHVADVDARRGRSTIPRSCVTGRARCRIAAGGISNSFVPSPTKSIGPPGQIVLNQPTSRENITLFHMNPTTAKHRDREVDGDLKIRPAPEVLLEADQANSIATAEQTNSRSQ